MQRFPVGQLLKPVNKFIHRKFIRRIILLASAVTVIMWVNAPFGSAYVITEVKRDILPASPVSGISGVIFLKSTSKTAKQHSPT